MVQREHAYENARRRVNKMAGFEAHNLARPGDIALADDTGVCLTPRLRGAEVLELAKQKSAAEVTKCAAMNGGVPVADLLA